MRCLAVLCFLATSLLAQGAAATPGPTGTPTLQVVSRAPLTIMGRGFAASRDVTVVVQTPHGVARRVLRPSAAGRFRLELRGVSLTGRLRCGAGVAIAARVENGELVLWHQVLPNCPAPLRPPAAVLPVS